MLRSQGMLRAAASQCRRLSTVAADGTLGAEKFFPPLFATGQKLKDDKEGFTLQFERIKAAVLGKSDSPEVKKAVGEGAVGLSEADIKDLGLADKFLARRLRLQALKYRDYLVETGKLGEFEKLTAEQAWAKKAEADKIKDPAFPEAFSQGKVGTDSPAFAALPEWGKEAVLKMKEDEEFISKFTAKNPESAKNIEAAVKEALAAQKKGGIMPTVAQAKDPSTCLYTIEGTPEYDFQWRWTQQADMLARTPAFEYLLTEDDKAFCQEYNSKLADSYRQFLGDAAIPVPDKVTVLE